MVKHIVILAVVLAVLLVWERSLVRDHSRERTESARFARLVPREAFEGRSLAAIRVITPDNEVLLYLHHEGVWGLMQAHGAPALESAVEALLMKLDAAEGVVQSRRPEEAADFGFDGSEMYRLALCGPGVLTEPDGDVIFAIDIGRSIRATGGSYVRPLRSGEVWAVNVDFRSEIARDGESRLPPMLDPNIIPEVWPGVRAGLRRIVVDQPDRPPLVMARQDVELTPQQEAQGLPPWTWTISQGDDVREPSYPQLFSYSIFLVRAPYAGVLARRPPAELGLDQPRGVITLESAGGDRLQLVIGGRTTRGGIVVFNTVSQSIFEVDPALVQGMMPDIAILTGSEDGDPWEDLLRR